MRIVVALGGNALLRRGEPLTAEAQRANVRIAAAALAPLAREDELVISHGNGPQVGLLALQGAAYDPAAVFPLDVLGAETEGMIGYMIEQELANALAPEVPLATLLTMVEVDPEDPAFGQPTKFVGPVYEKREADRIAAQKGWQFAKDGERWRRVVPSPMPKRILEIRPIRWLIERGAVVICAGGGGIPTAYRPGAAAANERTLVGVEAVVDKDACSELLARELDADLFIMATDVDGVYDEWGTPAARRIHRASSDALAAYRFPPGSMGPKVDAACRFARATGRSAAIGALGDLSAIVREEKGTLVSERFEGISWQR
jgi:carbamate kinase